MKKILLWTCIFILLISSVSALLSDELLAWFSFEAATVSGTNLSDESGQAYGTLIGGPNVTYTGKVGNYAGFFNDTAPETSFRLDSTPYDFLVDPDNNFSYCRWAKLLDASTLTSGARDNTAKTGWADWKDGIAYCNAGVCSDAGIENATWYGTNWVYKCITFQGATNNWTIYLNGTEYDTFIQNFALGNDNWAFGRHRWNLDQFSDVVLDEVAWWNRTLNGSEISLLYNSGSGLTYAEMLGGIVLDQPDTEYFHSAIDTTYNSSMVFFDDFMRFWNGTEYYNGTALGNEWSLTGSGGGRLTITDGEFRNYGIDPTPTRAERDITIDGTVGIVSFNLRNETYHGGGDGFYFYLDNNESDVVASINVHAGTGAVTHNGRLSATCTYDGDDRFTLFLSPVTNQSTLYVGATSCGSQDFLNDTNTDNYTLEFYSPANNEVDHYVDYIVVNMRGDHVFFTGWDLWNEEYLPITVTLDGWGNLPTETYPHYAYSKTLTGLGHNITSSGYLQNVPQGNTLLGKYLNATWHYQYNEFYQGTLTVNANLWNGTSVDNFTIFLTDSNGFSKNKTTTNGTVHFYVDADNYTINITPQYWGKQSDTVEVSYSQDQTYTFTLYEPNFIYLNFKDEYTDNYLTVNTSYTFWSTTHSFNGSTATGKDNQTLQATTYRIDYTPDGYDQRSYYITITNQSFTNLTLYCINASLGDRITVNVQDETGVELTGYYVKPLRQFINGSDWRVVEIGRTNYDGQTFVTLKKYTVPYAFIVQSQDGSITQYFSDSFIGFDTITLSVNTQENVIASWSRLDSIAYSLTRSGVGGKTITLIWSDTTNTLLEEICLRVEQRLASTNVLLSEQCSSSTSGILNYTITASSGSFIATVPYETTTQYSPGFLDQIEVVISEFLQVAGPLGLFMALILTATIGVLYAYNPSLAIFGAIGGLFFSIALGLNLGMVTLFSILAVVGMIIAFRVRA